MTDASATHIPKVQRRASPSVPLPKPEPFGAPVLITDCVSPLAEETVLSLLMKRMMRGDLPQNQDR